jgi:inorganic triphosphatase YgiF
MQSDLVRVLDSIRTSGVLADIYDHCNTITKTDAYKNPKVTNLSTYENAQKHIAKRLDELLALETFVHDQTEVAKHHELRIAAKRLRYTMEIFSTLYRNGFTNEIAVLKQLQDILGEMHDYYVWRQDLTTRRHEIPPEARGALRIFQVYLGKLRKSRYTEFVSLWDKTATQGFFVKIRQKIDTAPSGEIVSEFLGTLTKVALIADIHGNLDALEAVVDDATNSGLEIFLNAGDAVGFGIYPSQVLQILRSPDWECRFGGS